MTLTLVISERKGHPMIRTQRKQKWAAGTALVCTAALALSACGSDSDSSSEAKSAKDAKNASYPPGALDQFRIENVVVMYNYV